MLILLLIAQGISVGPAKDTGMSFWKQLSKLDEKQTTGKETSILLSLKKKTVFYFLDLDCCQPTRSEIFCPYAVSAYHRYDPADRRAFSAVGFECRDRIVWKVPLRSRPWTLDQPESTGHAGVPKFLQSEPCSDFHYAGEGDAHERIFLWQFSLLFQFSLA
jgi:hypothetical protein